MRITICSSSADLIDERYKTKSKELITFLAEQNCDLNWGSGSSSIMGLCYTIFSEHNRQIYGYTTEKYKDDLVNLPNAKHEIYNNTFDFKKGLFEDSDLIVVLPGGTGTISELLSFLEENRSNNQDKKIIIYNIDNHFDSTIRLIDDMIKRNFNNSNIYDYLIIVNNINDFEKIFKELYV